MMETSEKQTFTCHVFRCLVFKCLVFKWQSEYQTEFSRVFKWHLNTGPFSNWIGFDHSNTKLVVWYSDLHCTPNIVTLSKEPSCLAKHRSELNDFPYPVLQGPNLGRIFFLVNTDCYSQPKIKMNLIVVISTNIYFNKRFFLIQLLPLG